MGCFAVYRYPIVASNGNAHLLFNACKIVIVKKRKKPKLFLGFFVHRNDDYYSR